MVGLAARDHRLDAALPDQPPVLVVVVAAVSDQALGSAAWPTDCAARVAPGPETDQKVLTALAASAAGRT
jgi:hypothetical protein